MEFDRIENNHVYLHGTQEDKYQIITLINGFKNEFEPLINSYTNRDAEEIEGVTIDFENSQLIISENNFKIIFGCYVGMFGTSYFGEHLGFSKQKFMENLELFRLVADMLIELQGSR